MRILVTGATGMVGAEVVRQAILDENIEKVYALARRPIPIKHEKVSTLIHQDFLDYRTLKDTLSEIDACIWCIGPSQTQVSKSDYILITHDYTLAAAKALLEANPGASFVFLSGEGADSTEQSKTLFARVKGKTENALKTFNFRRVVAVRPAGIRPIHKNPDAPFWIRTFSFLLPILEFVAPRLVIRSDELARILIKLAKTGAEKYIITQSDLKEMAKSL